MTRGRILYIEDNVENRKLVKRILEAEGYEVVEAENGTTGLEKAKTASPDLILMDINLPDIDGYDCTARLRQIDGVGSIPIVALTANVMEGDRQKALDAGCDGYIPKPIDVDQLIAQVAYFRQRVSVKAALAAQSAPTAAPAGAAAGKPAAPPPPSKVPLPPPSFTIPASIRNAPPPPPVVRPPMPVPGTLPPPPFPAPAAPQPASSANGGSASTPAVPSPSSSANGGSASAPPAANAVEASKPASGADGASAPAPPSNSDGVKSNSSGPESPAPTENKPEAAGKTEASVH